MSRRHLPSLVLVLVAGALLGLEPAAGQVLPREATSRAASRTAARTPWGDPDLQGVWTNSTTTPLERPDTLAGKDVLSDEERADLDTQAARNADRPPRPGDTGAYNDFWFDRGKRSGRTALIVDRRMGGSHR